MRILLALLILFSGIVSAQTKSPGGQPKPPPKTQKKATTKSNTPMVQGLSKEELKEMEDAIKELEEDDPEMAKQMREMMKTMGGGNQAAPTNSSVLPVAPRFVSPRVPIVLKTPVPIPTKDQAKDRLLWMQGKKINDSMLISTTGTLMLYRRKKQQVVIQPDKKYNPFLIIEQGLVRHEELNIEYLNFMARNETSFLMYPHIAGAIREFDKLKEIYYDLARNTVDLNPNEEEKENPRPFGVQEEEPQEIFSTVVPDSTMSKYKHLLWLMKNYPTIEFDDPPIRPVETCFNCDSNKVKEYEASEQEWLEKFYEYEGKVARAAALTARDLDKIRGPEAEKIRIDLEKAHEFIFNRGRNKNELLERKFGDDFRFTRIIVLCKVSLARQESLLGRGSEDYLLLEKTIKFIEKYEEQIKKQIKAKNHTIVMNVHYLIGVIRQKHLIGGEDENQQAYVDLIQAADSFNRYKMTMDFEFAVSSDDIIANGTARTSEVDFYVSIGVSGCKFQLFPTYGDYKEGKEKTFYIPIKATGGVKNQKEEDDKWVKYPFAGKPADLMTMFPAFTIGFCEDESDSAYISLFRWQDPNFLNDMGDFPKAYTIDFMAYINMLVFNDAAAQEASALQAMKIATDFHAARAKANIITTRYPQLNKFAYDHYVHEQMRIAQVKFAKEVKANNKLVLLFNAEKNGDILIDSETEKTYSGEVWSLDKGRVRVKVVHAPK